MTIAVAIRTGSAVVFAADSKVTTSGIVGYEEDGNPRMVEQTYDNAFKVTQDRSGKFMAMVAGHANIGRVTALDFISTRTLEMARSREEQDTQVQNLIADMVRRKREYWAETKVPPDEWPGPTLLLAAPQPKRNVPRVWRINLEGQESEISEILQDPWIWLEGAYSDAFTLLYGFEPTALESILGELNIERQQVQQAMRDLKLLRPIEKLNLWAMPVQDAIDMAVFLANVQVQMDRFLPGTPACGGPIDVMVLQMAPIPGIQAYPGKKLHHPMIPG